MLASACELSFDVLIGSFEQLQLAEVPCFSKKMRTTQLAKSVAVSWWRPEGSKRPQLRGIAVQLDKDEEQPTLEVVVKRLADEAASGGALFKPIEQKEVRALTVCVSTLEHVSTKVEKFVLGRHGVIVTFQGGTRVVHLVATTGVEQIVEDAKQKVPGGEVSSVQIFVAKHQERLSFRQYAKIDAIWKIRESLLEPYLADKPAAHPGAPGKANKKGGGSSWRSIAVVLVVMAVFLLIRFGEVTYNVQWENFRGNYAILGLAVDAPLKDVKRVYRKMSLTKHPDKGGDAEEWVKFTNAYREISDFHKGTLKILDRPTRFEYEYNDNKD